MNLKRVTLKSSSIIKMAKIHAARCACALTRTTMGGATVLSTEGPRTGDVPFCGTFQSKKAPT
jgi:hypothetical protein